MDPFDLNSLAVAQGTEEELPGLTDKDNFKAFKLLSGKLIRCDTSHVVSRPFVPKKCRVPVFDALHNIAYPEIIRDLPAS